MTDVALRNSLLATLAYFDMFEYPLTLAELLRYRYQLPNAQGGAWGLADMMTALREPAFGHKDGYFFLAGREHIVDTRHRRFRESARKMKRARRVSSLMRLLPSVRMIAVCNSLALHNADLDSDIDLFVVCAPGTLWATRLLVVGALKMLRLRPDATTHADRVCMSFFVSSAHLDLSRYALTPDDTYLRYWIATLLPLHDEGGTLEQITKANTWIRERLPAAKPLERRVSESPSLLRSLAPLLQSIEARAKKIQMKKFPAELAKQANKDSRVVISGDVLKFHVGDRRAEFELRFQSKLRELGAVRVTEPAREKINA